MGKKFGVWFIVAAIICSAFLVGVPQVQAATISVPGNYATIQAAINAAAAGDTINVAAGTYAGHLVIDTKTNLTIQSTAGAATTIIIARQTHSGTPDPGISIKGSTGITIDGFTVNDVAFNSAGVINPDAGSEPFLMSAIWLYDASNCVVKNNVLNDYWYGVFIASEVHSPYSAAANNNTIQNNQMHGNNTGRIGVYLYSDDNTGSGTTVMTGNTVTGNTIEKTYYGIYHYPSLGAGTTTLSNNTITGSADLVNWYPSNTYTNPPSALDNGIGIVLGSWDDVGAYSGTISGNTISACQTGIRVNAANFAATTVNNNSITGNLTWGVWNDAAAGTLAATPNWWGAANGPGPVGPGSGDNVSANVIYTPWETNTTTPVETNTATTLTFYEGGIAIGTPGAGTGAGYPLSGQPSGTTNPSSLGFRAAQWWDISFTPSGCTGSVTITVAYSHRLGEETFALYYWNGTAWTKAENQVNGGHNGSGDVLAHQIRGTVPVEKMGGTGFGLFGNPAAMPSMDWWALAILCLSMLGVATLALYRRRYMKD